MSAPSCPEDLAGGAGLALGQQLMQEAEKVTANLKEQAGMKKKENNAKGGEAADAAEETDTAAAAAADSANPASTPPPRPAPGLKAGTRVELQGLKARKNHLSTFMI